MDRQARLAAGRYTKPGISLMRYAAGGPLISKPLKPSKPKEPKAPPAPAPAGAGEEKPAEKPVEEKPVEEKAAEEKPAENKAQDKPADDKPAEDKPPEDKPAEKKPAEEKVVEEKGELPESEKAKKKSSKSEYHFTKLSGDRVEGTHKVTGKKVIFKAKTKSMSEGASSDSGKRKHKIKITITRSPTPSDDESEKRKDASKPVEEEKKVEEKVTEPEKKVEEPAKSTTESGEKEEEVKMPGQWKSDDWTSEQDATITKMKGANRSWKDIAIEVGASKKDVRTRFEELQKAAEGGEKTKDKHPEKEVGEDGGLGALGDIFEDKDSEKENSQKEKEPEQPKESDKNQKQNKDSEPQDEEKPSKNSGASEDKADESGDGGNAAATGGGEEVSPVIEKGLKADEIWTRDDCNVLEMLKERHHNHKWQHMQAGFFNWTGRMVAADIIQKKFADDGLNF